MTVASLDSDSVHRAVQSALGGRPMVVVAVSGGVDSMTLLHAAAQVLDRGRLLVATFDHGTGPAATRACDLVEATAKTLDITCVRERSRCALHSEAELREARWTFLRAVADGAHAIVATAHTTNDQVETVLIRVLRHAGARGLAALYAESAIARPFIGLRREEVVRYATANGLAWVEDPTNESRDYLRNRVRHELLPALRRVRPTMEAELLDISRRAAAWRADVDAFVKRFIEVRENGAGRGLDVDAAAIGRMATGATAVLWPAVLARAGVVLDRRGTERLARFAERARVGARIELRGNWEVVRSRDAFQLRPVSANKRMATVSATMSGDGATLPRLVLSNGTRWGADWSFELGGVADASEVARGDDPWSAVLPADCELSVRSWEPGDAMRTREGRVRKVKRLLSDAGVTGHLRAGWPVVLADDQIVWIPGVRRSDAATARSGQPGLPFACAYFYRHLFR